MAYYSNHKHNYNSVYLYLLWIPYIAFLLYWMSVDDTIISQLIMIVFVVPAFFQPLFYYFLLGLIMSAIISVANDDGRPEVPAARTHRRRNY